MAAEERERRRNSKRETPQQRDATRNVAILLGNPSQRGDDSYSTLPPFVSSSNYEYRRIAKLVHSKKEIYIGTVNIADYCYAFSRIFERLLTVPMIRIDKVKVTTVN